MWKGWKQSFFLNCLQLKGSTELYICFIYSYITWLFSVSQVIMGAPNKPSALWTDTERTLVHPNIMILFILTALDPPTWQCLPALVSLCVRHTLSWKRRAYSHACSWSALRSCGERLPRPQGAAPKKGITVLSLKCLSTICSITFSGVWSRSVKLSLLITLRGKLCRAIFMLETQPPFSFMPKTAWHVTGSVSHSQNYYTASC